MSLPLEGSRDVHDGIIISMVPDICLTPAGGGMVPVPYTIWCRQADAANLANSVRQTDDRSHAIASIVQHCYGDEPGTGGGIHSGTTGADCTPKTWSQTVRAEGRSMVRHNDLWWINHRNTYGQLIYTKDLVHYGTPEEEQITAQMRAQETDRGTSTATIQQTSQLAQQIAVPGAGGPAGAAAAAAYLAFLAARGALKDRAKDWVRNSRQEECCIGTYAYNSSGGCASCTKGKRNVAHHGMIDYPFRSGTAESSQMRAPGAPTYEEALTICLAPGEHNQLHRNFRNQLNSTGASSTGLTNFGQVKQKSFDEIDKLAPSTLSNFCKNLYKEELETQYKLLDQETLRGRESPTPENPSQSGILDTLNSAWSVKH